MTLKTKRVLLVEDSTNDIELTLEALADQPFAEEVIVLNDGQQALDYLNRQGAYSGRTTANPILVVLDLKLPKVDGLEVLRVIKGEAHLKTIPVVMLTSSREESDLIMSYGLGVNAYVVKPLEFSEFVETLRGLSFFWTAINQPPPSVTVR